jgi:DNA-binding CsgD family transcriptional regulator
MTPPTAVPNVPSLGGAADSVTQRLRALAADASRWVDHEGRSSNPNVTVVGIGCDALRTEFMSWSRHWRSGFSVTTGVGMDYWGACHDANMAAQDRGVHWVSVFDTGSTRRQAKTFIASVPAAPYYFADAPEQFKLVDDKVAVLNGPLVHGRSTALAVTDPMAVARLRQCWREISRDAIRAWSPGDDPLTRLTSRQREIAYLMADGEADEAIAHRLGVSLRTVRYDVAGIIRVLDAQSRFGAGLRLGQLGFGNRSTDRG